MTQRRTILTGVAVVAVMVLAAALVLRRASLEQPSGDRAFGASRTAGPLDCGAVWGKGVELAGVVGEHASQAYFDRAPVPGTPEQLSGIVVFPGERGRQPLADTPIGLQGPPDADGCGAQLKEPDGAAHGSVWRLRLESATLVKGTRTTPDGRTDAVVFDILPETRCDGAGEWRTFSSPQWPITFDYPADWVLTEDDDDVNLECPSVTRLAAGGSWLTFERGQLSPVGADSVTTSQRSFNQPYWFVRLANGEWRVSDLVCAEHEAHSAPRVRCARARRSERNGMTVLQGAAGEHRLYRAGVGYLGQGRGITRYLFVLGDRWVSLDSAGVNGHFDDVGRDGGPVLLDGAAVGDRVVRSISSRLRP